MAKIKLTAAFCRDVDCPPNKRKEVFRCTEQTGFGLEVRQSGKTYYQYYTKPDGKAAQIKIGAVGDITFDDAKRRAKELRSRLVLGGDPAGEKAMRKAIITYGELIAMHVEHAQNHLRSHACVEMAHRLYLKPRFGKLRLDEVTPQAIERYFAELGQTLAPATVDRLRLVMNRSYRLAQLWNLPGADRNPVAAVARPRYDNKRTCLLSAAEVERLLQACAQSPNPLLRPIVQLLLATAARKRELLTARIDDIDFERAEWRIPLTKNGRSRRVPLSKAAMAVIAELPRYEGCPWLLPNPATRQPFDNIKRAWATACKAAGLPGLHIHDLRHAAIGAMINNGVSLHVAGKVAGHLRSESTAPYAYVSDISLAAAVEAGADNLMLGGSTMTSGLHPPEPDIDALVGRLRGLELHLRDAGVNKHDRAHMLINACIGEGVDTGPHIIDMLAKLGFNKQHAGITLKAGLQRQPEWPNWGRNADGTYHAPQEPS